MEQMTRGQAELMLTEWAAMMRDRDRRVVAATGAGLPKQVIARRMGLSRNTVYSIVRQHEAGAGDA
jgi:DNA-binding CsgD family transcriptional regulator